MSTFWLGGTPRKVPIEELSQEMYEDRFFMPGIIHGNEDVLICVCLNDSKSGIGDDVDCFDVSYLTKSLILDAERRDPNRGDEFYDYLMSECENFGVYNDGGCDFPELVDAWKEGRRMTNYEICYWAKGFDV